MVKEADEIVQMTLRFPAAWLRMIDELADRLPTTGTTTNRTEVARAAMLAGLQHMMATLPKKGR